VKPNPTEDFISLDRLDAATAPRLDTAAEKKTDTSTSIAVPVSSSAPEPVSAAPAPTITAAVVASMVTSAMDAADALSDTESESSNRESDEDCTNGEVQVTLRVFKGKNRWTPDFQRTAQSTMPLSSLRNRYSAELGGSSIAGPLLGGLLKTLETFKTKKEKRREKRRQKHMSVMTKKAMDDIVARGQARDIFSRMP
jgi:hypothetical protein